MGERTGPFFEPRKSVLTEETIRAFCRQLDPERHRMLRYLSRDEIYDNGKGMAPGGLLLAEMLAEQLSLKTGDRVLDAGCGRGLSSVFLASRYKARVVSVDLWIGVQERQRRAAGAGVGDLITPLQGDIGRGVPIDSGSFDAIFCMQSFHCFGTRPWLLRYLASLLKPGGRLGIAQGCFRHEVKAFPPLFMDTGGWHAEYEKYHSPGWWRNHFLSCQNLEVTLAREVPDGDILWEDDVLYRCERQGWSAEYLGYSAWLIRQIVHGRKATPALTHCMVVATKRDHAIGRVPCLSANA
ncbi:MAG: SAM-dependent methyltransferase [Burkholderiales bacterium]